MTDFVHCNKCILRPTSTSKEKYHLTNCGHIFCDNCVGDKCHVCNANCNTTSLTADINSDLQIYFVDIKDSLNKIMKIIEFQNYHRQRLMSHYEKESALLISKYKAAKSYIQKQGCLIESIKKDNVRLRNMMKQWISTPKAASANRSDTPNCNNGQFNLSNPQIPINGNKMMIGGQEKPRNNLNWMQPESNFRTPQHPIKNNNNTSFNSGMNSTIKSGISSYLSSANLYKSFDQTPCSSPNIPMSSLFIGRPSSGRK